MWKVPTIVLVLGVTLANVWMNWRLWRERTSPSPPEVKVSELVSNPLAIKGRAIGQNGIFRPDRKVIAARPPWSNLESEDYHVYATNLRAIGCPEGTVRDILVADIGHAFEEQLQGIQGRSGDPFWITADQRGEIDRRRVRQAWELRLKKWGLLRELFQFPVDETVLSVMRGDGMVVALASPFFGFMEREQFARAMGVISYYGQQLEAIAEVTEGILLESDYARARQIREQFEASLGTVLGNAHLEEASLRILAAEDGDEVPGGSHGFQVSGAEMRQIFQIRLAARDLLGEFVVNEGFTDLKKEALGPDTIDVALARFLGPDRFADYSRAKDERFRGIYTFATGNGLSKNEAISAFEARVRAEDEMKSIRAAKGITAEENILLQAAVKARLEGDLKRVFGPVIAKEYLGDETASWIGELITVPVEAKEVEP